MTQNPKSAPSEKKTLWQSISTFFSAIFKPLTQLASRFKNWITKAKPEIKTKKAKKAKKAVSQTNAPTITTAPPPSPTIDTPAPPVESTPSPVETTPPESKPAEPTVEPVQPVESTPPEEPPQKEPEPPPPPPAEIPVPTEVLPETPPIQAIDPATIKFEASNVEEYITKLENSMKALNEVWYDKNYPNRTQHLEKVLQINNSRLVNESNTLIASAKEKHYQLDETEVKKIIDLDTAAQEQARFAEYVGKRLPKP